MRQLRGPHTGDYLEVWCPSPVVSLVDFADHVEALSRTGLDSLGIPCLAPPASVVARLRGFDQIVSWYGANRESFQEAVYRLGLPFTFRPALPRDDSAHAVDFFLGQTSTEYPRLRFDSQREARAVIHPFSGGARKNWPLDQFRSVANKLAIPVMWSAGPEESLAEATRFPDLRELARAIASSKLYIGNDSGITHLAAATGTPVIALFGEASNPRVWAPRGEQVRVIAASSLEEIAVDTVVEEAHRLLARA